MSGFSPIWLRLREPFDRAARSRELVTRIKRPQYATQRLVDLGAGTGANLRYIAPLLGGRQHWTLVDDDAAVLASASLELARWARQQDLKFVLRPDTMTIEAAEFHCHIERRTLDLSSELADLPLTPACIVTASALLDLVSRAWVGALAQLCRARSATFLCALSYDGSIRLDPADPLDETMRALINQHQRSDKGFGPALGPLATESAAAAFGRLGYAVSIKASDWQLPATATAIQTELLDGWQTAARAQDPMRAAELDAWHARRMRLVAAAQSTMSVGHADLLALPNEAAA